MWPFVMSPSVPAWTATSPAFPAVEALAVLEISPPDITVICGAVTITEPASPLTAEVAEAIIPLPAVKLSNPPAVT
jgi:hypothetical protein